jgi:DnaJ family protein A protein 5
LDWAAAEGEDPEEWECVACRKTFRSEAAWDSHERSKKHMKEVERLQREMQEENEELGLEEDDEEGEDDIPDVWEEATSELPRSLSPDQKSELPSTKEATIDGSDAVPSAAGSGMDSEGEEFAPKQKKKKKKKGNIVAEELPTKIERRAMKTRRTGLESQDVSGGLSGLSSPLESEQTPNGDDVLDQERAEDSAPQLSKREKRRAREAKKVEAHKEDLKVRRDPTLLGMIN